MSVVAMIGIGVLAAIAIVGGVVWWLMRNAEEASE